jgi:rubrerythrin
MSESHQYFGGQKNGKEECSMATDESISRIKTEEATEELRKMVTHLVKVEEEVVEMAQNTIEKAESPTVKFLVRAIQHDSRKHADLGRAALDILEYKNIIGPKERKEVWNLLKKHDDLEKKHREFVAEIKSLTKTPALKYIFEQIWEDEKKHHAVFETLMTKRFEKDPDAQWGALLSY